MKREPSLCYYCGQPANTIDHVIPQTLIYQLSVLEDVEITKELLRNRALKVPACKECNCMLSNSMQSTLMERKTYLKQRIRKKYAKLLDMPQWEETDIESLGCNLRQYITNSIKKKKLIKFRLQW